MMGLEWMKKYTIAERQYIKHTVTRSALFGSPIAGIRFRILL